MGLDMYLKARIEHYNSAFYNTTELELDVFKRTLSNLGVRLLEADEQFDDGGISVTVDQPLAYWRKHPNLHGYIVEHFADGVDECQDILLCEDDIKQIISAIEDDDLPETQGFFFGRSPDIESDDPEEAEWAKERKEYDLKVFQKALELVNSDHGYDIYYRASW